jgi:hypothetical protein
MRCVYIYNMETEEAADHWWGDNQDTERKAREYRARIMLADCADIECVEFDYEISPSAHSYSMSCTNGSVYRD